MSIARVAWLGNEYWILFCPGEEEVVRWMACFARKIKSLDYCSGRYSKVFLVLSLSLSLRRESILEYCFCIISRCL